MLISTSEGVPVNPRRFTLDDSNDLATNWTPDSKAILFNSDRNGTFDIFRQSLDSTVAEPIPAQALDHEWGPMAVTSDGVWSGRPPNCEGRTARPSRPKCDSTDSGCRRSSREGGRYHAALGAGRCAPMLY